MVTKRTRSLPILLLPQRHLLRPTTGPSVAVAVVVVAVVVVAVVVVRDRGCLLWRAYEAARRPSSAAKVNSKESSWLSILHVVVLMLPVWVAGVAVSIAYAALRRQRRPTIPAIAADRSKRDSPETQNDRKALYSGYSIGTTLLACEVQQQET